MTRTVLVIDDLSFYRRRLRNLLRELGYGVHEAGDGAGGVDMAVRVNPDAVLLDEVMPGSDSHETLRALCTAGWPVIVLSPRIESEAAMGFLDEGAVAVISKTASRDEIHAELRAAFGRANAA